MDVDEAAIVLVGYCGCDLNVKERRNKGEFVVATTCGGVERPETGHWGLGRPADVCSGRL